MSQPLIVLKFGSSVLRTSSDLPQAVHEIFRYVREGFGVVAVVSAFEGVTDRLIAQAKSLGADPEHDVGVSGLAALVASGERETAAALQIVLSQSGLESNVLDPLSADLRVDGNGLEGAPSGLAADRLRGLLEKGRIVIVPGFFGADAEGSVSLLGRGGSDWTALYVASQLGAHCRLLKDTDGIYERDPNREGATPLRFERLSYDDALSLKAPVVQESALQFARFHRQTFEVAQPGSVLGTSVGHHATLLERQAVPIQRALRVTLLGLGAVGRGVYERLLDDPRRFEVVAVAVRDRARHEAAGVPSRLLFTLRDALSVPADVVVEAIGGVEEAGEALTQALRSGCHVVSANKAVIAAKGEALQALAEDENISLSYSAAVGGVVPVLETIAGLHEPVTCIEGVLNGTSNFVLDRLAQGVSISDAVKEAQDLGYAEADPVDDLSGLDAARKLTLLARDAFGVELDAEAIGRPGRTAIETWRPTNAEPLARLIARVASDGKGGVAASVDLVPVAPDHSLAQCRGANNGLVITLRSGSTIALRGRGAGRWPTSESVMGDLLELWRKLQRQPDRSSSVIGEFEERAS
ncbi:MAG: homoserine dehydrogenase [Vicinamibacteria bacterium]